MKRKLKHHLKRYFFALEFIVFIVVIIALLILSVDCGATGQIEMGLSYNSNTKVERSNFLAKIEEKKDDLEVEIYSNLLKEQEDERLNSLRIDSDVQVNYYSTPNVFYYALAGYDRNIEYGILDKTSVDIGAGYKKYEYKYPFRVQSGISARSIYYGAEMEKDIYFNLAGDIMIPYKFLEFRDEAEFLVNTKQVEGTDIEINNVSSVIAKLSDDFFLSFSLSFSHLNNPPRGYPKEIKIWMLRGGFSF